MTNRRDFLTSLGASTLLALAPGAPEFLRRAAAAAPKTDSDAILVVVQLAGGNDGLNTVVPFRDDAYASARPTLRLPAARLHRIDGDFGFHPQAAAFARLLKEGRLTVLHGVGYPNPQPGHEESMDVWQTAALKPRECATGWIGRTVDRVAGPSGAAPAVFLGDIRPPFCINAARAVVPTLRTPKDAALRRPAAPAPAAAEGDDLLAFVRQTERAAAARSEKIEAALRQGSRGTYPDFAFAAALRGVAQMIRADLGVRIFYTELGGEQPGGFDTHAGQAANHGALLEQLSEGIAAFVDDLAHDRLLDRVLLMTFSEFGRTVAENGRRGTDHGSAAPVFLAGGRIKGGLAGEHPNLTDLENGGQRHRVDFRRVYATALGPGLGFDPGPIVGPEFAPLDVLRGAT